MNDLERWTAQSGLTDAYRMEWYFSLLAERSRQRYMITTIIATVFVLVTGTLAGLAFSQDEPSILSYVALCSGLVSAVATLVSVVFNYSARSVKAASLAKEVAVTIPQWRSILISGDGDASMISELSRRQKEIEAPVSNELPLIEKLNDVAERAAYRALIYDIHQGEDSDAPTSTETAVSPAGSHHATTA